MRRSIAIGAIVSIMLPLERGLAASVREGTHDRKVVTERLD